jgi:class 3 adenylate cyclase
MHDGDALFKALRQAADAQAVSALEALVDQGSDEDLARINALAFATARGLDEDQVIAALLHAAQLGLFEMSWNVLCPSCGGVLDANATLRSVRQEAYHCTFCAVKAEPNLDDSVEVCFGVSPRVGRIGAHDPDRLPFWDYHRQVFFGSGLDFPVGESFRTLAAAAVMEAVDLRAGERMILAPSIGTAEGSVVVFDPVTHTALFVAFKGEATSDRQDLSLVFGTARSVENVTLRPGPLRLTLDNRSSKRVLPGVFLAGPALETMLGGRRPYLTAKRLLCNQTFRDLYRTDTLSIDQRLKITSLAFLFTDLKGSTELYEQVGDLVAYDLVRAHFGVLNEIVASEGGAVVKTIGDAVMATFPRPQQAVAAALRMRDAMRAQQTSGREGAALTLKIGIHAGPCLAVNLNDRQDYFGQTVNIASRVQDLAAADSIFATDAIVSQPEAARLLATRHADAEPKLRSLRGIGDRVPVYEFT